MREIEPLQKLLYAYPPVDEVDLIIRPPQHPVPEFELFGRDDLRFASLLAEEVAKKFVLTGGGGKGGPELQDPDFWFPASSKLLVRVQQRRKQRFLAPHLGQGVAFAKLPHRRRVVE